MSCKIARLGLIGVLNYLKIALDDKRIVYLVIEKESFISLHLWDPMVRGESLATLWEKKYSVFKDSLLLPDRSWQSDSQITVMMMLAVNIFDTAEDLTLIL